MHKILAAFFWQSSLNDPNPCKEIHVLLMHGFGTLNILNCFFSIFFYFCWSVNRSSIMIGPVRWIVIEMVKPRVDYELVRKYSPIFFAIVMIISLIYAKIEITHYFHARIPRVLWEGVQLWQCFLSFLVNEERENWKKHYKGPSLTRQRNDDWPNCECWLGIFVILGDPKSKLTMN